MAEISVADQSRLDFGESSTAGFPFYQPTIYVCDRWKMMFQLVYSFFSSWDGNIKLANTCLNGEITMYHVVKLSYIFLQFLSDVFQGL